MARSITKSIRAARRADAEVRQKVYDEYSTQEKLDRALRYGGGTKQVAKLAGRLVREQRGKRQTVNG